MYQRILIPIDGSRCSEEAIAVGLELARRLGAAVTFLYVLDDPVIELYGVPYGQHLRLELRKRGEEALEQAQRRAEAAGVPVATRLIEDGEPVHVILDLEEVHDLTVMATHGRRRIDRLLLGSVAEGVLRRSQIPHLMVRCPPEEQQPSATAADAEAKPPSEPPAPGREST